MQDKQFDEDLNETERSALLSFKRICKDFLGNHKAVNYQDVVQDLLTSHKLWDAIWVRKSTFWSHIWIFSQKTLAKSVMNTLRLWKSGNKASGPQVCWQTIAEHCRWMYLTPNTGKSHTLLHFRGKFLPVSWAHEILFCTFQFLCIFEILPDRKIQYTYLNWAQKVPLSSSIEVRGTKKKLNYVDQCHFHCIWS